MFLVGLTGGIASGKSTVVAVLRELGCAVIDADVVARQGESSSLLVLGLRSRQTTERFSQWLLNGVTWIGFNKAALVV